MRDGSVASLMYSILSGLATAEHPRRECTEHPLVSSRESVSKRSREFEIVVCFQSCNILHGFVESQGKTESASSLSEQVKLNGFCICLTAIP